MGGRGSYASGKRTYEYETIGMIEGVKVVRRINGSNKVPEESYTSKAYIVKNKDGSIRQYREFDEKHKPKMDVDYQIKPSYDKKNKTLHIHDYKNGERQPARIPTKDEYSKYEKYFKGENK